MVYIISTLHITEDSFSVKEKDLNILSHEFVFREEQDVSGMLVMLPG
jgi:hypothetical protein